VHLVFRKTTPSTRSTQSWSTGTSAWWSARASTPATSPTGARAHRGGATCCAWTPRRFRNGSAMRSGGSRTVRRGGARGRRQRRRRRGFRFLVERGRLREGRIGGGSICITASRRASAGPASAVIEVAGLGQRTRGHGTYVRSAPTRHRARLSRGARLAWRGLRHDGRSSPGSTGARAAREGRGSFVKSTGARVEPGPQLQRYDAGTTRVLPSRRRGRLRALRGSPQGPLSSHSARSGPPWSAAAPSRSRSCRPRAHHLARRYIARAACTTSR